MIGYRKDIMSVPDGTKEWGIVYAKEFLRLSKSMVKQLGVTSGWDRQPFQCLEVHHGSTNPKCSN